MCRQGRTVDPEKQKQSLRVVHLSWLGSAGSAAEGRVRLPQVAIRGEVCHYKRVGRRFRLRCTRNKRRKPGSVSSSPMSKNYSGLIDSPNRLRHPPFCLDAALLQAFRSTSLIVMHHRFPYSPAGTYASVHWLGTMGF